MEHTKEFSEDFEVAEIGLIYRNVTGLQGRPQINSSKTAYELLLHCWNKDTLELQESFKVLLLNRSGKVLGIYEASQGSTCGTLVDTKLVLVAALRSAASSMILSHNHPSGSSVPSDADRQLTKKLAAAAKLLDLRVLDHVIVTANGFFSFGDEGLL